MPSPKFSQDVIYTLAWKHLTVERKGLAKLEMNPAMTDFMLVSRCFRDAVYSQFARLKKVHFKMAGEIEFFTDDHQFTVSKWFIDALLKQGKFRPSAVKFSHLWINRMVDPFEQIDASPTQCLRRMIGLPVAEVKENALSIENIDIYESRNVLYELADSHHFIEFLNLDAKELKFKLINIHAFEILPAPIGMSFPRIESITLELNARFPEDHTSEFPLEEWMAFLDHLLLACPILKKLCIRLNIEGHENNEQFMLNTLNHMVVGVKALSEEVLVKVKPDSPAEIVVELRCWVNKNLPIPATHPLFSFDSEIHVNNTSHTTSPMGNRSVRFTVSRYDEDSSDDDEVEFLGQFSGISSGLNFMVDVNGDWHVDES